MDNIKQLKENLNNLQQQQDDASLCEIREIEFVKSLNEFKESRIPSELKNLSYDEIRTVFHKHYNKWNYETMFLSDFDKIFFHPDFKAIENMGWAGVPFLIEIIKNTPDFIVYALRNMTGLTSPAKGKKLNIDELCELWLEELKK